MPSHHDPANTANRPSASGRLWRSAVALASVAVIATACSASGEPLDAVSVAEPPTPGPTAVVEPATPAATAVVEPTTPATTAAPESAPPAPTAVLADSPETFRMETEVSFAGGPPSGTFEVTTGAGEFGCSAGTFEDLDVYAGLLRTYTCDNGRDGELVIFFNPNEDRPGPGDLNATWDTRVATGTFSAFDAEGDYAFEFADDGDRRRGGTGTFVVLGDPARDATDDPAARRVLDDAYLAELVELVTVPEGEGAFMIVALGANGDTSHASVGYDQTGNQPTPDDAFRIGSITKVFTSLATLQLVDSGAVDLDAPVTDYITRVPVSPGITVRDLLQHTSGIPNANARPDFFDIILEDPARAWSPEEQIELVADVEAVFEPGARFGYSNTNYLLLGILIEEVAGRPYHEVVRNSILDPLDLESTYVAGFEDGPEPFGAFTGIMGPVVPTDFDYTSIATAAWSAGGIVSSAADLHTLFTALYDGRIVSDALVTQMTENSLYGLGLELFEWSDGLVGHSGQTPGYITVVRHDPASGLTTFTASTGPFIEQRPALAPLYRAMSAHDDQG